MITNSQKNQFIELRAEGLSYDTIAGRMGLAKSTLIKMGNEMGKQINDLSKIRMESLIEKYRLSQYHRLERFSILLEKIKTELEKKDLSELPVKDLFVLYLKTQEMVDRERFRMNPPFHTELNNIELYPDDESRFKYDLISGI